MRRGPWILGAALAVLALTGAAVAQESYENVDPSGQTVVFWHQHSQEREDALNAIVDDFNNTNEYGITVQAEYQGGYSDIFKKMLPLLGTADAPNIVVAYQNQAATYQLVNGLVDMNPLVDSAKWGLSDADRQDFFPGFFKSDIFPSFNGERLGLAPNRSMEVLYYNADWLAELRDAGAISFDGPPTTPDQFKEAACAATKNPFSSATTSGSLGYELSIDASRFASWTFAFGGNIFDDAANEFTLNSDAAVQAWTFMQGMFDDGCATLVTENYGDQTDFGAGRTLFTVGSSSGLPFYASAVNDGASFDWSVAAIPHTTPDPVMNIYGASVSIPAGHSKEADLASWLFIKYYTSPDIQARWAKASEYFPVRQSVAAELTDYFDANPGYKTAFDLLKYGTAEPPVPGYDFVRDEIASDMSAIVGGAPVQETLDAANATANEILTDQLKDLPTNN